MEARGFRNAAAFRGWLEKNHATETELILRCVKKHAAHNGVRYFEALDEALCFGWIDGIRRALDADSFTQRFTPRKAKSYWSKVNIGKARALIAAKRMAPPGLAAFETREFSAARYSFENRPKSLPPAMLKRVKANAKAAKFYLTLPPGYLRTTAHWVTSAAKEETREQRLRTLIEGWARQDRYPAKGFAPMNKRKQAKT